ncbi:MAG: sulfur carrier protein ThiS [Verrucomicrobia bacterium]|nr:MAG: sulfur carrier protein ThiS [Verrucomicrobiota bacterium]
MIIFLNGNDYECATGASLPKLLDELGLATKPVVVEYNEQAIFPREYAQIFLHEGDRVEIIMLAAGG